MNEFFGYRYNPSYTPEPHFIPGYGGYLPRVLTRYGITYGSVSHEVSREEPAVAARLAPLDPSTERKTDYGPLNYQCNKAPESMKKINSSGKEDTPIPDYVCPGYMGCLTFQRKGLSPNGCCDDVLRAFGYQQDPYDISREEAMEDPLPGPPPKVNFSQGVKRCKNGVWMRCELPSKSKSRELMEN